MTPDKTTTGSSATSYITTLTEFTCDGIKWKMNQWNPSSLQVKTNQSSAASEFRFYNTTAFSGKITKVVVKFSALTLSNTNKTGFIFVGGSSEVSSPTGGTDGTWNDTDKTLTWTPSTSDNFTYFAMYQNGKVATGTNKLATSDAIVVTYETSGGGSDPVAVTSVSLDESEISLKIGKTQSLTATVTPANATNKSVTWTSNNTNVATVSNAGLVTAVGTGNATITVTTEDGNKTATCAVEVVVASPKSSLIFTAKCNGSGTADDGAKWIVTSDGKETTYDGTKGIHYGTNSAAVGWVQLSTSDIRGTIKKVVVNASGASGTSAAISVKVGTTDFIINNQTSSPIISTAADFEFTGSANGKIVVYISQTSAKKAIYCKSIVVSYESNGKQEADLAYDEEETKKLTKLGDSFTAPTLTNPHGLTVVYESNNTDVAEVAADGSLTIKAVGVAEITASFAGNENYNEGSASYAIYVTAHAGTEADPYTVADARLAIDCGAGVSGVYATGIVSQIVSAYNEQYGNITYNFSTDGQTTSDQLQAFRGKAKDGENFTSVDDVKVGDEVVVKGNLTKFNSTYEFAADNQLYSLTRNKEDAGLAYAVTEIEKNIDEAAFTNALTNPHSLAVTYSSSAEVVATIDKNGEVTIVGMGTTTIKATFAGDAAYSAGEASYTLKVNDPSLTKVTFDATTDIATVNAEGITKSGINVQTTHTDGVNDQGTDIAFYQTFKSHKLVVTSTVGNIKRIEFVTTETKYAATGFEGVTDNAWAGDASSVELTASSNQVRMSSIIVYYKADTRADAGLSWSTDAIELTVGDAFTAPTLTNPNRIAENEISVESDNTNLATVNAGVVSLIESATGTATITAMFEGNENYKPASVSYTITVNAVGAVKNVVILAKYDDKWYALMNEQGSANNTLNALEVVYSESNGAILNLSAEEQAKIIWKRSISSNKATFKNGTNYITGSSDNTNLTLAANECEWTIDGEHYVIGARTILYNKTGYFKNYATSNVSGSDYSNYVVVLEDPQFLTQSVIRGDLTEGKWGTFCYNQDVEHPTGASFFTIAYVGMENGVPYKVFFDEIGEGESLQAGKPYVYIANDDAIKGIPSGDPVAEGSNDHGFIGVLSDFTFQVSDAASQNKYYVIYDNQIRLCDDGWFKLLAGRAYIDIKDPNLPTQGTAAPAPGRRRISLSNPEAPQTATSIDAIESNGKTVKVMIGEQLCILRDGKLYDTTGRLVK